MSPPVTFGPATPLSVAPVPVTFVALPVVATGGTLVQYLLGGFIPTGQTIVAWVGAADTTMTPAATRPPSAASHLRCEYLVMHVLPDRKSPRDGLSAITTRRPPDD